MSVRVMAEVWELDFVAMGLTHAHKFVLLAWADHADDEGVVHASIDRIAWKSEYSDRQIKRLRKELLEHGVLCILAEAKGPGFSTVYRIRPVMGRKLAPFRSRNSVKGDSVSPVQDRASESPTRQGIQPPEIQQVTPCHPSAGKGDILSERGTLKQAKGDTGVPLKGVRVSPQPSITSSPNRARDRESEPQAALPAPRATTPEEVELFQLNNSARRLGIEERRHGESLEAFNRRVGEAQLAQLRRTREAIAAAEVSA